MPRIAVMALHSVGSPGPIRQKQRVGHVLVPRERFGSDGRPGWLPAFQSRFETGPSLKSVLERERPLHVAQARRGRRIRDRALETGTCVGITGADRSQPALGFLLQAFERLAGNLIVRHDLPPVTPGVR
jgi:hypothetical protein